MARRSLVLTGASLLVLGACSSRTADGRVEVAAPAERPVESHDRGACDPGTYVDVTELPAELRSPPTPLGTHEFALGSERRVGELKLWTGESSIPQGGHERQVPERFFLEVFVRGAILPDYEQEGIHSDNYVHSGLGSEAHVVGGLREFRWLVDRFDAKTGEVRLVVDRVACGPRLFLPRLEPGQSRRVWLSTQGVRNVVFADGPNREEQVVVGLSSGADWERRDGAWRVTPHVWSREGTSADVHTLNPSSPEFLPAVQAGPFTVHFERVETGDGTQWWGSERQALAVRRIPNVHVLVRIERER
ncbi:hypothetical protein [Nannocystis punicea]|uniref:Lipoprotein n=1 Tax=Nannocystis punicea TaxID=2995304 RepID=A0ABY7H7G0_9BACT|nr:hypothetical protein [Nannocystis poenicansa]WAS94969.1 hypothetical protein O0S08_02305 [Nannocystis poenicansa]